MGNNTKPYIVLFGDVGVGKSTLVEKLTGETGRSSRSATSFTQTSEIFESWDNTIDICDTPGANAMDNRFEHNCHIAHALNWRAVSCILVVVRALDRLDGVVEKVSEAISVFLPEELPLELVSICVTHMDKVRWDKDRLSKVLTDKCGIESVVTSSLNTSGKDLQSDILKVCANTKPMELGVDSEMFLKLFKLSNNNVKVMRQVRREINRFTLLREKFNEIKREPRWSEKDLMDMTFEFQAWMFEEITEAQKRLARDNNFDFMGGPAVATQAGHIANMTNQLRKILSSVRIESMKYHKDFETNFRECPWCSLVWQKVEGCSGQTTCGALVSDEKVSDNWSGGVTAHFAFIWDHSYRRLHIKKKALDQSEEKSEKINWRAGRKRGCGKTIT